MPMTPILYAHPFSAYCWKVLIALWENATAFEYRRLDDPVHQEAWAKASPMRRMPLLIDGDAVVPEATVIIEHLCIHHPSRDPTRAPLIPGEAAVALKVRLLDRMADNYLMGPVQTLVFDRARDEANRDAFGAKQARALLDMAYGWWDSHMTGREWAASAFGLADCAAGPALFYADWVHPIPAQLGALRSYRARLLARQSMARAVDEARPFRSLFPFGDPGRD